MCSIMGYCGPVVDLDKFKESFQRTISRGPDDSRIVDTGNGLLGFHRLAIMGLTPSGMQPFQLDGSYVVCNGEIYGFEKIKEELSDRYSIENPAYAVNSPCSETSNPASSSSGFTRSPMVCLIAKNTMVITTATYAATASTPNTWIPRKCAPPP